MQIEETYFPEDEKITRFGFISHMEKYIKSLLQDPLHSNTDEYLQKFGIDWEKAQKMLLDRPDRNNSDSAVMKKEEKIIQGPDGKDKFIVKYYLLRKNYKRKMRNMFIKNFEKNIVEGLQLNEDGEGAGMVGSTTAASSGQFTTPLFGGPVRRKTLYITQNQVDKLKEAVEMDTAHGDFGYDAPVFAKKGDPSMDHKNIMKKSFPGNV